MNQERLAEIRQACDTMPWGALPMVRELLDYIDGLKFANGVLDSAAKDAQAWSYEAQTAKEAYCELLEANRVTEAAGGVIAQLNGMIDELRAQLEAQRGGAVVVPAWNRSDFDKVPPEWSEMQYFGAGYALAISRIQPIPADRVLADGMVGGGSGGVDVPARLRRMEFRAASISQVRGFENGDQMSDKTLTSIPEYQLRVIEEKKELDTKIGKLDKFLENPKGLDDNAESLLRAQFSAMTLYSWILKERLSAWGISHY